MKKKVIYALITISLSAMMTACGHEHTWIEATCEAAKTCSECGETEGEKLEHTWVEVTCAEPKHCSQCGTTEGESLPHTLTEANYQQAPTCEVCGATDGEKLEADFEKYGSKYVTEIDKEYEFINQCDENPELLTTGKVVFSNYEVFESKEGYEAKEGYEWRSVIYSIIFDDENANEYGQGGFASISGDFYDINASLNGDDDENGDYCYSTKFNGEDVVIYDKGGEVLQNGWVWIDDENAYFEQKVRVTYLVPVGYDGVTISIMNAETRGKLSNSVETIEDAQIYLSNENTITFRLQ